MPNINIRRSTASDTWQKPSLVRDTDRRELLVERLVDSSTQLVSLLWPQSDADGTSRGLVIPLRMFIKETLRRSRTSYSTLQLTLYYLLLVTSKKIDSDSLKCGRRMFLTALILASKYLQDRNFSSKAWSKISGLRSHEINANESAFLAAIDWNLYLKATSFEVWSEVVGKCTDLAQFGTSRIAWEAVLATVRTGLCFEQMKLAVMSTSVSFLSTPYMAITPPAEDIGFDVGIHSIPKTCTHATIPVGLQTSTCGLSALLTTSNTNVPAADEGVRPFITGHVAPLQHAAFSSYNHLMAGRPLTPPQTPPDDSLSTASSSSSSSSLQSFVRTLQEKSQLRTAWPTPVSASPASTVSSFSSGDYCQYAEKTQKLPPIRQLIPLDGLVSTSTFAITANPPIHHKLPVMRTDLEHKTSESARATKRSFDDFDQSIVPNTPRKRACM